MNAAVQTLAACGAPRGIVIPHCTVFDCEQNSDEWYEIRRGLPTASCFSAVLAEGQGKTRAKYLRVLAGETVYGRVSDGFSNKFMERGHGVEPQARSWYEFERDVDVMQAGFIRHNLFNVGYSPDGLVGDDGIVEIKSRNPDLMIELFEDGRLPSEHKAQVQGALWITGRAWCDFVAYCNAEGPKFLMRVYPEPDYIAKLAAKVAVFNAELKLLVEKYRV